MESDLTFVEEKLNNRNDWKSNDDDERLRKNVGMQKKEKAKSVCIEISRLLSDKCSRSRGNCMFRKRRKRSERFAIIGYGTQPTEEDGASCDTEEPDSECAFTSSDDEIEVYDHPGPCNLLEQDTNLTSAEKIIHRQLKNLADDTKKMNGKGAKMFAKRQERMEKYVVDGNSERCEVNDNDEISIKTSEMILQNSNSKWNDGKENIETASFFSDLSSSYSMTETQDFNSQYRSNQSHQYLIPNDEEKDISFPNQVWSSQFGSKETMSDYNEQQLNQFSYSAPNDMTRSVSMMEEYEERASRKLGFRSVRPPTSSAKSDFQPCNATELISVQPQSNNKGNLTFVPSLRTSNKTWSPVKFQPKSKEPSSKLETKDKSACPSSISNKSDTAPLVEKQPPAQPFKSVFTMPTISSGKRISNSKPFAAAATTASVKLLEKPISQLELTPHNGGPTQAEMVSDGDKKETKTMRGDLTPKSSSPQPLTPVYFLQSSPKIETSCSHPILPETDESKVDEGHEDLRQPKVAACMRLLDPSKGKYEPKTAIVYKQTPSATKILNDTEERSKDRYNRPIHFNKGATLNDGLPQASYLTSQQPPSLQQKYKQPQALGALAGDLKGKGARMFEKQQKRMDDYTRESNGMVLCGPSSQSLHGPVKGPEEKTKENMSQVVGEFKKVAADPETPRRPSGTRTRKSKEPFHYHSHYVPSQRPAASDFVCADDVSDRMSDSNQSTTSSLTSHDRFSRTSSSILQTNESEVNDVIEGPSEKEKKQLSPVVAPKPKIRPFEGSFSPKEAEKRTEEDLPPPPTYEFATDATHM